VPSGTPPDHTIGDTCPVQDVLPGDYSEDCPIDSAANSIDLASALYRIPQNSPGQPICQLLRQRGPIPQGENPQINPTNLKHSTPINAPQGFVGGDLASGGWIAFSMGFLMALKIILANRFAEISPLASGTPVIHQAKINHQLLETAQAAHVCI